MLNSFPRHKLKILITRPAHQAKNLCEKITAMGAEAISFPTLEIADLTDQSVLLNIISQLNDFDIAIFVSANAVFKVMPHWPKKELSLMIAAIGPATAQALSQLNLDANIQPLDSYNSEGLLKHPQLLQCAGKHILIFSGLGGRNLLADTLQQRGALVTKVAVYQRVLPQIDVNQFLKKWQYDGIDIIVSTSNESLQNLIHLFGAKNNWLYQLPLLVISQRMADYAAKLGFVKKILVADNPGDEAILQALKAWYASINSNTG